MKQNTIKAKDSEILVSGKGKTLDRVLESSNPQQEGKIIDIGEIEVRSSDIHNGVANIVLSGVQKSKLKAATASDICKVFCKMYITDGGYQSSTMIGGVNEYQDERIAEFVYCYNADGSALPYITLSDNSKLRVLKIIVATAYL